MICIACDDPLAPKLNDIDDVDRVMPGTVSVMREWLRPLCAALPLFGIVLLNVEVSASLGGLIGASCFDRDRATTVAIVFMVFVMCAGGYFVDLTHAPQWLATLRYTSFWYYSMGLFTAAALPTPADRHAFAIVNGTVGGYSFSLWSLEGHYEYDVGVLLAFALVQRVATFFVLKHTNQLRFS